MFPEQVNTPNMLLDLFSLTTVVAVMLAVAGVFLIDVGLVRSKNAIDTVTQKMAASMFCALGFAPVGYAIWNWQFYQAFEVPDPLKQAISDWSILGNFVHTVPQDIDPKIAPQVDQFLIFFGVFLAFAVFLGAVIHTVGVERMKPAPMYTLSFLSGAILLPFVTYLLWGPVSPLTIQGLHDDIGGFAVYIPLGAIGLTLAWRLGPRIGAFEDGESMGDDRPGPTNLPLVAVGVSIVLAALLFFAVGGGYQIPGFGYFGIAFTTSGLGVVTMNLFAAIIGGGIGGALLSYRVRNAYWAIGGPFMGYVSVTTFNDIGQPWYQFLIAFAAVYVGYGAYLLMHRVRIDEEKLVPLVLAPAVFGAVVGGFTEWHTATGGYPGIEEGKFAFQSAEITPWWQLIGIGISFTMAALLTLVVCFIFERFGGLRVTREEEIAGLDLKYWPSELDEEGPSRPVRHKEQPGAAASGSG